MSYDSSQLKQGLKNPTPYHVQQTQLRLAKERGDAPTPQNSYVSPLGDNMLGGINHQFQFAHQLAQFSNQHTSPRPTVGKHNGPTHPGMRPQDTNSPNMDDGMDYSDPYNNTLLSPSSASPPDEGFESPPFEYPNGRHVQAKSIAHPTSTNDGGYGESPSNTSMQSFCPDNEFILDDPTAFSPGSGSSIGPIDMKSRFNGYPHGQGFHSTSFDKLPLSAPPMFGAAGDVGIGHGGFSMPASTGLRFHGSSELNGGMGSIPEAGSFDEHDYTHQINLQHVMEKRRRRRESHNAVERRRRDNINEKIQELGALLPDQFGDGSQKPNKGAILRKSVEHIKQLQREASDYKKRMSELENIVGRLSAMGISLPDGIAIPTASLSTTINGQSPQARSAQGNMGGVTQGMQGIQGMQLGGAEDGSST